MTLLDTVHHHRQEVIDLAIRYRVSNARIFGSTLKGAAAGSSDIDLLVDAQPDATLLDLGGLQAELQDLLGAPVDLLTPEDLPPAWRGGVLSSAVPI